MRPTSDPTGQPPRRPIIADEIADMLGVLAISAATLAMLWLPAVISG